MRLLFTLDLQDYAGRTRIFQRDSARSIIIRDHRAAMIHSLRYGYYKFPGGGIEPGETPLEAMIRETREEAGLIVLPGSVREYGYVHRVQKSDRDEFTRFVQDNYYYLCEVSDQAVSQELEDYEASAGFTLEYVDPKAVIEQNRRVMANPFEQPMFEREARVLELLLAEGYFD